MSIIISGIQQIGIGNPNTYEAWKLYRKAFGMDVPVFDEAAIAAIMLPYTGGKERERHAVLAMNLQGGSGMEIWQYTKRTPQKPAFTVKAGDLGIFVTKIKSRNVKEAFKHFKTGDIKLISDLVKDPIGNYHFFVQDPYDNIFELVESDSWFSKGKQITGGPSGVIIGVSDIEKSLKFYKDILEYDTVEYDISGQFDDFEGLPGGEKEFRRVLISHSQERKGAFSRLLGASKIELIEVKDREAKKIFENRFWGDIGFIHLCFDINGMEELKQKCTSLGHPFTVDSSNSFDMGEAAGHFAYIEDPDGTLIEFVETHKIPIIKKLGWFMNLRNRKSDKALPDFIIKAMGLTRVKD